jgi:hypothetical protein
MGIISQDFNPWLRERFPGIFADPIPIRNEAWVLIIDGSLFIRAVRQWTGTWADVLNELCRRLDQLISEFPNLEVLVFRIDAYGGDHVIKCKAKDACHVKRYSGAPPLPPGKTASTVYKPSSSCENITQEMTFGHMANRIAFNAMVSRALLKWAMQACLTHNDGAFSVILEGVVQGTEVTNMPVLVCKEKSSDDDDDGVAKPPVACFSEFLFPAHIKGPCMHSEGDIGLVFWTQFFSDAPTVVYSCDTDLLIALLFHMRRMSESGLPFDEVPPLTLYKVVSSGSFYIDIKLAFLILMNTLGAINADSMQAHPIEVFAFLYTTCGNDFCQPYANSEEKDNGLRFPAVLAAYERYGDQVGALFELPHSGAPEYLYGAQKFPTIQYTVRLHTARVAALMQMALYMQENYDARKVVAKRHELFSLPYFNAQAARASWCIGYYANAGVPGLDYARGDEVSTRTNKSLYGWEYDHTSKLLLRTNNVHCSLVHANGDETACPSPIDKEMDERQSKTPAASTQRLLSMVSKKPAATGIALSYLEMKK